MVEWHPISGIMPPLTDIAWETEFEKYQQYPEYLKLFGKTAAHDLAVYTHHHDHTHLADGSVIHADGSVCDHGEGAHDG